MGLENPRHAIVNVFVFPGGDPEFRLESDYIKHNELTFKNGSGHKGCIVDFILANADTTGYFFPGDKLLALASEEITSNGDPKCPKQGTIWPEFKPVSVSTDRKKLTVHNENGKKKRFGYTLFVTDDGDKPKPTFKALDPIGNNQNGDKWPFLPIALTALVVAGVAAYSLTDLGD